MKNLHQGIQLLIAIIIMLGTIVFASAEREQTELASKLIRLHVVANSDSEEDQAYKLEVRDTLLAELTPVLEGSLNRSEAKLKLEKALPELSAKHSELVLSLENEHFPERQYDSFSLPAGEYTTLRAVIGSGTGRNWWCVLFPPLCTEVSGTESDSQDAFAMLSEEETELIKGSDDGYVIKFKTMEIIDRLRSFFNWG